MSVSFCYAVVRPAALRFSNGTSSDVETLHVTFGGVVSSDKINMLRAMHRATQLKESLWSEIADALERLGGDDMEVTLKIWTEY